MTWIFPAFLAASAVHMLEEYGYPGGFPDLMKRMNPRFAAHVTTPFAVLINGLQLLLCAVAIAVGGRPLVFSMSIAGLLFINGMVHLGACTRLGKYTPGAITGALLYLPLSIYAYGALIRSGALAPGAALLTGLLGLLYQAVPIAYLAWRSRRV